MPSTSESPKNVPEVLAIHPGPCRSAPSLSPFVIKLETYFRMAGIKYKNVVSSKLSKKGKMPFVEFKGKEIADTAFIIEFFNEEMGINLCEHLSPAEKAISLAFQRLCEENLYWVLVNYRWNVTPEFVAKELPLSSFYKKLLPVYSAIRIKPKIKANLNGHGMGRHSLEEINHIGERDLTALSDYLGDKDFLMGSEPSEVDAVMFSIVVTILDTMEGAPYYVLVHEKMTNLVAYSQRMKQRFWPDYDECCYHDKKPEPEGGGEKVKVEENKEEKKEEGEQEEQQAKAEEPAAAEEKPDASDTPNNDDQQEADNDAKEPEAGGDAPEQKAEGSKDE